MPVIIAAYWLISILLDKLNGTNAYFAKAAILEIPGYGPVVLDPENATDLNPDDAVLVECLPGSNCVVVPESFTFCPERVYRITDLIFDYLVLVLPISVPILWAWIREDKLCRDEEACPFDKTEGKRLFIPFVYRGQGRREDFERGSFSPKSRIFTVKDFFV
jgi:hypothetical protein